MQDFVTNIFSFIYNLALSIGQAIERIGGTNQFTQYGEWFNKQIFQGTLINIGLTWRELFLYGFTWFLVIFFICYFVKLVFKVIGLICLR